MIIREKKFDLHMPDNQTIEPNIGNLQILSHIHKSYAITTFLTALTLTSLATLLDHALPSFTSTQISSPMLLPEMISRSSSFHSSRNGSPTNCATLILRLYIQSLNLTRPPS